MAGDTHTRNGPARPVAAFTAALAGVACLAAACSGSPSPASHSRSASPGAQALAYSKCMQTHGVPDYPDPKISHNGNGTGVSVGVGTKGDLSPNNPQFQAASRACRKLQPAGEAPQQQTAQELATDVKFADCMRSHGYPSFPDPDGRGTFNIPSSINAGSVQFSSVTSTCQSKTHIHVLSMHNGNPGGGS